MRIIFFRIKSHSFPIFKTDIQWASYWDKTNFLGSFLFLEKTSSQNSQASGHSSTSNRNNNPSRSSPMATTSKPANHHGNNGSIPTPNIHHQPPQNQQHQHSINSNETNPENHHIPMPNTHHSAAAAAMAYTNYQNLLSAASYPPAPHTQLSTPPNQQHLNICGYPGLITPETSPETSSPVKAAMHRIYSASNAPAPMLPVGFKFENDGSSPALYGNNNNMASGISVKVEKPGIGGGLGCGSQINSVRL